MSRVLPCITPIGPKNAKVVILGEAPGEQEELTGIPFIGSSGQELDAMLSEAGLDRKDCWLTTVLLTRPPNNKLEQFCVAKKDLPPGYALPPVGTGQYLHPEFQSELTRLYAELTAIRPNLIIALGNLALWALTGSFGITRMRGSIQHSKWGKVLPTFHPAYILRDWSKRPIAVADLLKAKFESDFPDIRRPERYILIDPTLDELRAWAEIGLASRYLSCDVETRGRQITCIGFAYSPSEAVCIPFYDQRKPGGSYWSRADELIVRREIVQPLLACPAKKIFQNGLYDLQYILKEGFKPCNVEEDTMLQHHALYPEMQKSLGFLGSIYTNESSWKLLRQTKQAEQLKKDD